ncbi:isopentenyl-diphosphate Delta-isomerase 1 isoform X1 [Onthophagus taurus]|uniref:isopentenyl-diphosphate Delta-isomerase 1 isoform X1 n=1 Tax=Onthophagus taurus TaxID=166361 RepID=UPI000C2086FE|nr:isopentenyl-diphosphate Delta-isomerase 1 isoform X1 [Onthophagus taurus]XP_022909720.1 isopentenyl-diphosphate Delta-isomerase 1 isoform X1 [Onthophagus taurus]
MHSIQFRHGLSRCLGRYFTSSLAKPMTSTNLDPVQEESLKENCLLVDRNDKVVGVASKKECHLVKKDGSLPLHRAFSVFLFDQKGDLLLQKRASTKITYPNCFTNTCCSHPIHDVYGEQDEENAIGVIRAAQRRLNYELGISRNQIPVDKFKYLTRIIYKDVGDGVWGEHELDYILFIQTQVDLNPNLNEVSELHYVSKENLPALLPTLSGPLTPWFELILKYKLFLWWNNLNNLDAFKDHVNITILEK